MSLATKSTTLAKDGAYFTCVSPTPGTGIPSLTAPTTFVDTKPYILVNNADAAKTMVFDYLRLQCTVAGVGGTSMNWAMKSDGINALRYTSGGVDSSLGTLLIKNPNMNSSAQSSAIIRAGAIVSIATTAASRVLGHGLIRPVIPVVGDTYLWAFGGDMGCGQGGTPVGGTLVANLSYPVHPVLIGPGQWFAFHLWLPGPQSTASEYEIEMGWYEV